MSRYLQDLESIKQQLSEDVANLKRLADTIPQLLEKKQRQLERLTEVSRSMEQEDAEVTALIARYAESRPALKTAQRQRGRSLPADIMSLLHAAGPRGASLDALHEALLKTRQISKQNLSSTLSRMKGMGKIGKQNGMFVAP
jgi:chromosome segregation ATPase